MTLLTYQMAHEDIASLRDTDAEEIDEHDHIITIGTRGERYLDKHWDGNDFQLLFERTTWH